jgi:hypothetical protein
MIGSKISAIKTWIKTMRFELIKSYVLNNEAVKINYYFLGKLVYMRKYPLKGRTLINLDLYHGIPGVLISIPIFKAALRCL